MKFRVKCTNITEYESMISVSFQPLSGQEPFLAEITGFLDLEGIDPTIARQFEKGKEYQFDIRPAPGT
jgi:hypothetical protein